MDDVTLTRIISGFIVLPLLVLGIVGMWKLFSKAGQPGWAVLIPVYGSYVLLKIGGMSGWWLLLLFIPVVNIPILIVEAYHIAKSFGKSGVFGFFLLFLFPIGYMILGFGNSRYLGPLAHRPLPQGSSGPVQGQLGYDRRQVPYAQVTAAGQSPGAMIPHATSPSQTQPAPIQVTHFFCSKCGTKLTMGASFCGSCGSPVSC